MKLYGLYAFIFLAIAVFPSSGIIRTVVEWISKLFRSSQRRLFFRPDKDYGPPHPGPPFANSKPGKLSFTLGPIRFRQNVYKFEANKNNDIIRRRPGFLSFRLGPLFFRHVPTNTVSFVPCCTNPRANCHMYLDCNAYDEPSFFGH